MSKFAGSRYALCPLAHWVASPRWNVGDEQAVRTGFRCVAHEAVARHDENSNRHIGMLGPKSREVEAVAESGAGLVRTQGDWLKGKPAFAVIPQ